MVYTPNWLEGLSVAIDYFDITVEDAIGSIPAQASLDGCIAGGGGSETFCALIQRDTAGTLWLSNDAPGGGLAGISQQNANITSLTTYMLVSVVYQTPSSSIDCSALGARPSMAFV